MMEVTFAAVIFSASLTRTLGNFVNDPWNPSQQTNQGNLLSDLSACQDKPLSVSGDVRDFEWDLWELMESDDSDENDLTFGFFDGCTMNISTCNSQIVDNILTVFNASQSIIASSELQCGAFPIAGAEIYNLDLSAGDNRLYYIRIAGYANINGSYIINFSFSAECCVDESQSGSNSESEESVESAKVDENKRVIDEYNDVKVHGEDKELIFKFSDSLSKYMYIILVTITVCLCMFLLILSKTPK